MPPRAGTGPLIVVPGKGSVEGSRVAFRELSDREEVTFFLTDVSFHK